MQSRAQIDPILSISESALRALSSGDAAIQNEFFVGNFRCRARIELILGIPESALRALSSDNTATSFAISAPSKSGANGAFRAESVNDVPKLLA